MRISELAAATGVPVATLKFYLRQGLLHPGAARGATQADYDATHERRVRLIRALTGSVGLSTAQARVILQLVDEPGPDLFATLGRAIEALPPSVDEAADAADPYPRAHAAIARLGWAYDPDYAAVAQLEASLAAAESAGLPMSDDRLDAYGASVHEMAAFDIGRMPVGDPAAAVEYTVVGTALYEPVLLALRRLAHHDVARRTLGGEAPAD
ncbi:MerR family transcriptional regulator [Agromyces sp. SYSU T00194]|uniref:MerR family transcriptional regulator n=1 Tax=Agromyces chitinivorans TaxID=3158560 RepID=UPI0033962A5D